MLLLVPLTCAILHMLDKPCMNFLTSFAERNLNQLCMLGQAEFVNKFTAQKVLEH